jgi:glycosyltransferase involved in cell wall biosynthesis
LEKVASFIRTYFFPSETFIYEEIKSIKRFEVIVLASNLINTHLFPHPDIFTPRRKRAGFPPIRKAGERRFFYHILKQQDIRLVHAWYAWSGMMILPVCKKAKLPLITSFAGIDVSRLPRHFLYRRHLLNLFKQGDLFITMSFSMKKDVIELGCPAEKVVVHYGGIDIDRFRPPGERRKNSAKILMCGRMVEKKGFIYGILAFSRVLKRHPEMSLTIIGEGRLKENLEKLVSSLKIEDKVKFLGALPYFEVQKKMREADIFLSPNVTAKNKDKEGIPNTIKEAMASGLPVVSTYHAGIPELVIEGETGFLAPEKDIDALVERLDYLLSHPGLWDKMGKKGREVVKEKFNLARQAKELENIYLKFIK